MSFGGCFVCLLLVDQGVVEVANWLLCHQDDHSMRSGAQVVSTEARPEGKESFLWDEAGNGKRRN